MFHSSNMIPTCFNRNWGTWKTNSNQSFPELKNEEFWIWLRFHLKIRFVSTCLEIVDTSPTDTESIWTQFFKVQISLKLFGNTFYSTKYTSFSVRAYWPGLLHQLWYVWNQSWDLIDPPLLSNVSNHSNVFISKEDIYNLQFCLNICKGDLQKV